MKQRSLAVCVGLVDVYAIFPEKQFDDFFVPLLRGYPQRSFTVKVGLVDLYASLPEKQ